MIFIHQYMVPNCSKYDYISCPRSHISVNLWYIIITRCHHCSFSFLIYLYRNSYTQHKVIPNSNIISSPTTTITNHSLSSRLQPFLYMYFFSKLLLLLPQHSLNLHSPPPPHQPHPTYPTTHSIPHHLEYSHPPNSPPDYDVHH